MVNNIETYTFSFHFACESRLSIEEDRVDCSQHSAFSVHPFPVFPVLTRFFSPDPYVQFPGFTQNFNRYSYCLNNPLSYTDPSGYKMKWWQWALIGLGADVLTGGAISAFALSTAVTASAFVSTTGGAIYTTAVATAVAGSATLSAVDFTVSLGKSMFKGDDQAMQNWWNLTWAEFAPITTMFSYDKKASWSEWPMQVINNLTGGEVLQDYVGKTLGHALNIGGKITASGFYKGRLISRTPNNTLNSAISFGHFIYGDNIALNPNDYSQGQSGLDLFAHEYGHTYQSRITGPLYLFRYGIASIYDNSGLTEMDADWRGYMNLGIDPWGNVAAYSHTASRYKWYEHMFSPVLWPFMWMWNY